MSLVTCEDLSARTHVSAFSVPSQGGRCHQVSWGAGASEAGLLPGHRDIWPGARCSHGCPQGTTARSGSKGKWTAKSLLVLEDGSREPRGFGIRETTQSTLGRKSEDRRVGKSMGGPEAHRVGWVTEAKCPQGPLHTHRLVLGAMRAPDLQALPRRREPWGSLAPRQPGWARGCKGTASLCRQCPQVSANGDTPAIHAALPRPSRVLRTPVPSECSHSKSPLSALLRDNLRNSGVLQQTPFQSILFHFTRPNRSSGREKVVVPVRVKVRRVVLKGTCKTPPMDRRLMRAPGDRRPPPRVLGRRGVDAPLPRRQALT